jgi:two-component system chemotaxis response regulator CheB
VVVGASWGGLDALRTLLAALPAELDAAVIVAQHRASESHPSAFRDLLSGASPLAVCDADDKQPVLRGHVFLAPPGYHLLVEDAHLALSVEAPVAFSRPSIDVLLESAAESYRERCAGVILTGANDDGARGLARIRALGGAAVVQDPDTAERPQMPRAALAAVPDAEVAPLSEIGRLLVELCGTTKVPA